nr:PsiF family protein [Chitinivorax tropicus]
MKLITALFATLMLTLSVAHAADAPNKQQNKMAQCNKDAEGKKGDERKQFMSECLKNKKKTQQEKMASCNKEAEGKKGDERKKFMSECLKKDA